jgi:hypothetical protein
MTELACNVCSGNNNQHAVICEVAATQTGRRLEQSEIRIVGLRFRNLGIQGEVPVATLAKFTALKEIDFSSDPASPHKNALALPVDSTCVNLGTCSNSGVICSFDEPVCGSNSKPSILASDPLGSGGIAGIVIVGLFLVGSALFVVYRKKSSSTMLIPQRPISFPAKSLLSQLPRPTSLPSRQDILSHVPNRQEILSHVPSRQEVISKLPKSKSDVKGLWTKTVDRVSKKTHWNNSAMGEFSEHPSASHSDKPSDAPPTTATARSDLLLGGPGQWMEVYDETTQSTYWVNTATGEFRHHKIEEERI